MKKWMLTVTMLACAACGPAEEESSPDVESDQPRFTAGGKADAFDDADVWDQIRTRCAPPADDEEPVFRNDFEWGYTRDEMATRYEEIYASGKRLADRARFDDSGTLVMPQTETWGGAVVVPDRIVENVTLHIEHALERGYAEFVFFPDMGHSHLFIPEQSWDDFYDEFDVPEISRRVEVMYDDPDLLVLYHTAEQLEMLDEDDKLIDDRYLQWRFATRNPVGDNNYERRIELLHEDESKANTARDLQGYRYIGAGFNISASEDGCFPFDVGGERQWYDISLVDLPLPPGAGGDDFF
jgi:hypothetical protein